MTRLTELVCDGCGRRKEAPHGRARPEGWRRVHVSAIGARQWVFDVCGPGCAARVVDGTYEEEDRDAALHLVRSSDQGH